MKHKHHSHSESFHGPSSSSRRGRGQEEEMSLAYVVRSSAPAEETTASVAQQVQHKFFQRLWVAMLFFCVAFAGLAYRAYDLQVQRSESFQEKIQKSQYVTLRLSAPRGTVYDRNMTSMAMSTEVDSLAINPRLFRSIYDRESRKEITKNLADALKLSLSQVQQKLEEDNFFTWLKRDVSSQEAEAIKKLAAERKEEARRKAKAAADAEKLKHDGEAKYRKKRKKSADAKKTLSLEDTLYFKQEQKRVYPRRTVAAHVLGHTDIDGRGLAGVELTFDALLRGKPQILRLQQDTKGRHILLHPKRLPSEGQRGANLVLTINNTIQFYTEKYLAEAVQKFEAKRGIAIVMDPNNGDMLALAIFPTFDPNKFHETEPNLRGNWAVTAPYEPGSTLKVLTVAVARELNVVRPDEKIDDERGRMRIGRYTIRDDHPKRRPLTPLETIQYSSNIVSAKLAFRIGKERLYEYFRKFGLGQHTGIGIPGESKGIFYPPRKWARISLANIGFGQGVAVTPLQLTAAVCAIGNGGILYRPRLYRSIRSNDGQMIREFPVQRVRRVISERTSREMQEMMAAVVAKGTGKAAAIPGYIAAGKTGTAQKPVEGGRGYGKGRIGSFIGFVPAHKPRLAILVLVDEPKKAKYGGDVAAPAWSQIGLAALQHLGHTPGHQGDEGKVSDLFSDDDGTKKTNPSPTQTPNNLQQQKPVTQAKLPDIHDNTNKTSPTQQQSIDKSNTQIALAVQKEETEEPKPQKRKVVPNFMGLAWEQAHKKARRLGVSIQALGANGRGVVRYQRPSAGRVYSSQQEVSLVFR